MQQDRYGRGRGQSKGTKHEQEEQGWSRRSRRRGSMQEKQEGIEEFEEGGLEGGLTNTKSEKCDVVGVIVWVGKILISTQTKGQEKREQEDSRA